MGDYRLLTGDAIVMLQTLPDQSIDAIVTDPPYDLTSGGTKGFMNKAWDGTGIAFRAELWAEALRVIKPGGHLLAFGGTRTSHRMVCAIEDAGWEIRDTVLWLYGQGFPKSLDISKAIDNQAGATREVIGSWTPTETARPTTRGAGHHAAHTTANLDEYNPRAATLPITAPSTDAAKQWDGWGTALKPAHEPICLARAPLAEPTIAGNVLAHGTGAINVNACRIGTSKEVPASASSSRHIQIAGGADREGTSGFDPNVGRWPANVILDESAAAALDRQSGNLSSGLMHAGTQRTNLMGFNGAMPAMVAQDTYGDIGGASRFFYVAKPSREERDQGCSALFYHSGGDLTGRTEGSAGLSSPRAGAGRTSGGRNTHPTVKPVDLMRYLCRLITPRGGTVLDLFMGSGTTGIAALQEGFSFIGIEREPEYVTIARGRIEASLHADNVIPGPRVKPVDGQIPLWDEQEAVS